MSTNVQQTLVKGFKEILKPVVEAAEDLDVRRLLLQSLGLKVNGPLKPVTIPDPMIMTKIDNYCQAGAEESSLEDFYNTLKDLKQLEDVLKNIIEAARKDNNPEVVVDEMVNLAINSLTLQYLYTKQRNLYLIFEMLGAIEEHSMHYGGFSELFKKGWKYLVELHGIIKHGDIKLPEEKKVETKDEQKEREEREKNETADQKAAREKAREKRRWELKAQRISDALIFTPGSILFGYFLKGETFYGWDTAPSSTTPIADKASQRTFTALLRGKRESGADTVDGSMLFSMVLAQKDQKENAMVFRINGATSLKAPLGKDLELSVEVSAPDVIFSVPGLGDFSSAPEGFVKFKLSHTGEKKEDKIIIGSATGTNVTFGTLALEGQATHEHASFKATFKKSSLTIAGGDGDGFISKFLPKDGLKTEFDFGIGYSTKKGFSIEGGAGLLVTLPMHTDIGPVHLQTLTMGIKVGDSAPKAILVTESSLGFSLKLGGFTAVVDRIGFEMAFSAPEGGGNMGSIDLQPRFKPPTGVGLSVNAGGIKGGGFLFFDPEQERYAGAMELEFGVKINENKVSFQLSAIGLITTIPLPDGSKGFSILVIINLEFEPAFAIFNTGFFWAGIGGMIGISRTIQVDAMREGVKNNTLDNILFPENILQNITRIISDIRAIFPPKQDQFLFGLMLKFTWNKPTVVNIEFGVVYESANPKRLAILGVVKATFPTEDAAILQLQVNFLGLIDFEKGELSFDASLYNSRLLTFTLEGDMAVRASWGEEKAFLMSAGGFHPSFNPPARFGLSSMKRITLNLLKDNPKLTLTHYFAITSNTVQFGASIDFLFKISKFSVVGFFGFDVLFQFSPFRFISNIRASIEVRLGSRSILAISLEFELQGPTPWVTNGSAKFKFLFFSYKVRFNKTWGDTQEVIAPAIAALGRVISALEEDSNWAGELPANRFLLVSLRNIKLAKGEVLLQSAGSLSIRQNVLPLDLQVSRLGNNKLSDIQHVRIKEVRLENEVQEVDEVKDYFAPASYKDMEDDDKLKSPSYVQEKSGVKVKATDAIRTQYALGRVVEYEVRSSDYNSETDVLYELFEPTRLGRFRDSRQLFNRHAKGGAVGKSALSRETQLQRSGKSGISVGIAEDAFTIVSNVDLSRITANGFTAGSKAEADDALKQLLQQQPKLRDQLQVVPEYELAEV